MITLQVDGGHQVGASICVKAEGATNCRISQAGCNFTIGNSPVIYTLTKELIIDQDGNGMIEFLPAIPEHKPLDHEALVNIYFNDLIDRLVAELVMGWKPICGEVDITAWLASCGHQPPPHPHWARIWVDPQKSGYAALSGCEECGSLPCFSRDMAEAWNVVERLGRSNWGLNLYGASMLEFPQWSCLFQQVQPMNRGEAGAPNVPLAICLAALRAVGVPEGLKENA